MRFFLNRVRTLLLRPFRRWLTIQRIQSLVRKDSPLARPMATLHRWVPGLQVRVLPFRSFESIRPSTGEVILPESRGKSFYLKSLGGTQAIEEIPLPALGYNVLDNALVHPRSPVIRWNDVLYTQFVHNANKQSGVLYSNGMLIEHGETKGLAYQYHGISLIDNGIFAGGNWPDNIYHFGFEILSRIELLDSLPSKFRDYPLLLPGFIQKSPNHLDLVKIVAPDRRLLFVSENQPCQVENLVWVDSPVLGPPNRRAGFIRNGSDFATRFDLLQQYRERIFNGLGDELNKPLADYPARLFLARDGQRRPYNQDEIFSIFEKRGFAKVYMERFRLSEQIRLFFHAEALAGPTGAAWTGVFYASPHCRGLCFVPHMVVDSPWASNLAASSGMDLRMIPFPTKACNWHDIQKLGFHLDPDKVESACDQFLGY